jgi:hypothetical protein
MSDSATDIFKKRRDERYYSTLIGKYLMDSEMKFRTIFSELRGTYVYVIFLKLNPYKE